MASRESALAVAVIMMIGVFILYRQAATSATGQTPVSLDTLEHLRERELNLQEQELNLRGREKVIRDMEIRVANVEELNGYTGNTDGSVKWATMVEVHRRVACCPCLWRSTVKWATMVEVHMRVACCPCLWRSTVPIHYA